MPVDPAFLLLPEFNLDLPKELVVVSPDVVTLENTEASLQDLSQIPLSASKPIIRHKLQQTLNGEV